MPKRLPIIVSLFLLVAICAPLAQGCASSQPKLSRTHDTPPAIEPGRKPIVLVCPIDTLMVDEEISNLSRALGPLIRRDLFCIQGLSVIPTADTDVPPKMYFLKKAGLRRHAERLGADIITVGIMRGDSEKIEIEFKAYDVKNDNILIETTLEGKTSRIFRLQKELEYQFINALGIPVSEEEEERIASSAPRKAEAAIEYGRGLKAARRGNNTEALIALENACTLDASFAAPYTARAEVFREFNAAEKAISSLEKAVAIDGSYAEAWYQLNIYTSAYREDEDLAMGYCYEALSIAPLFGKARLSLGARLYNMGDIEGAIEQTKTAAEFLPTDAMPRHNLGIYYGDSGNIEEARAWFERALKVNPSFELSRTELMNLPKK